MVSLGILMLTIDRYETTKKVLDENIANIGLNVGEFGLYACDNGSTDISIIDYISRFNYLCHYRINKRNEGVAHSFNQLVTRALPHSTHICLMGNDILMPHGWGKQMIDLSNKIVNSGLIGCHVDGLFDVPPVSNQFGVEAHYTDKKFNRVFGTTLMRSEVIHQVGLFDERFGCYGLEDSELNNRVELAGFKSAYIPHQKSTHIEWDQGKDTDYRRMKDDSLANNARIYGEIVAEYPTKGIRCHLPSQRPPL